MHRIVIGSGKGGVGRSTLTANLGIALAKNDESTILIDGCLTSPNLTLAFNLENVAYTINDALEGRVTLEDTTYEGPKGVKIVPAAITLEKMMNAKLEILPKMIEQVDGFDFVLIDTPSGLRNETISALSAGEELIILATPELTALSDAMKVKVASEFLELKPIGTVLNQVEDEDYEISTTEIENILDLSIMEKIPYDKKVRASMKEGLPLLIHSPNSPAAKAIKKLAKKLVEKK